VEQGRGWTAALLSSKLRETRPWAPDAVKIEGNKNRGGPYSQCNFGECQTILRPPESHYDELAIGSLDEATITTQNTS
jgi:hypothetical protein